MPENICFGCGSHNTQGLQIKSYWVDEVAHCEWQAQEKYQGWKGILNGGILATLIDCHCMCTAMAHAYRIEERSLDSKPLYRYATGTMQIRYLKPVPYKALIILKAHILAYKNRKSTLHCTLEANNTTCVEAEVIAIRVYDSNQPPANNLFN